MEHKELCVAVWGRRYSGKTTLMKEILNVTEVCLTTPWRLKVIEYHGSNVPSLHEHNLIIYVEASDDLRADIIRSLSPTEYEAYKKDQLDDMYDVRKNKADIIVPISNSKSTILKEIIINYINNIVELPKRVTQESTLIMKS